MTRVEKPPTGLPPIMLDLEYTLHMVFCDYFSYDKNHSNLRYIRDY